MCSVDGCPVYTHPSIFWNSFQETEITTISQMMWTAMRSNSFAIVSFGHCEVEDEDAVVRLSPWLCKTAIQFSDRHCDRSFLLLRIADFVVDAVDAVDVSVQEIVRFPPSEHLAFSGIVLMHLQNLVAVGEVSGASQYSNEEPNVWRS